MQAAIADVFKAFWQTGSAYGVVGVFAGRRFPRRAYGGAWAGELRWGKLTHARVLGVLRNPSYAGTYVFGRYRYRRLVRPDGTITTSMIELPRSEWAVVIHDHHEGYITWEQFLANQERLAQNTTRKGQRPPREGRALCQGIVRCGACGGSMTTLHRREGSYYECGHSRADHISTPGCRSVKATVVDELVARRLLKALAPEEISLALAAADEHQDRRRRSDRALELRVERARYEAIRAERAFHACEPDNRLVARSLENRWEQKLRELKDAEAELAEHVVPSSEPSREQLETLARDLPKLWAAETTADRDRKRLLRTMIADVTLTSTPDSRELQRRNPLALGRQPSSTPSSDRPSRPTRSARHPPPSSSPGASLPTTPTRRSPNSSTPPGSAPAKATRSQPSTCNGSAGATRSLTRDDGRGRRTHRPPGRRAPRRLRLRPSTTGSQPASSPPAAGPPTGSTSRSRRRSNNNAASEYRTRFAYAPKPKSALQEVQYEATVPTIADRVAQAAVAMVLEPLVEPRFHPDSYGYRPGKSAHDALAVCRERCWRFDWAIDLDVQAFFDQVPWDLVVRAVGR